MKKQFLTLALLATVAVGGAFAGNAKSSRSVADAGLPGNPSNLCNIQVPCSPVDGTPCILEENGPQYFKNSPLPTGTGTCSIFLSRD